MDMLIAQGEISSRILTLRREQVMIDSDLAELLRRRELSMMGFIR